MSQQASIEELRGVVAGLTELVKAQIQSQKATSEQIAQLSQAVAHQQVPQNPSPSVNLRMPSLQLPQFHYEASKHGNIEEFLDLFNEKTAHLDTPTRLALLQQACVGEWPTSVIAFEKSKFSPDTTAAEKLQRFQDALKEAFSEPKDAQRRRLATELSSMKQSNVEPVEVFAFRFKNTLHKLDKLGEQLNNSSSAFVISLFLSKTKSELQRHLLVKSDEFKTLDEAISAAKRVERCFCPVSTKSHDSHKVNTSQSPPMDLKVVYAEHTPPKKTPLTCYHCNRAGHKRDNCPDRSSDILSTESKVKPKAKDNEICRLWNTTRPSPCVLPDKTCKYGRSHKCFTCSKIGCKAINHRPPLSQTLQGPQQAFSSPATPLSEQPPPLLEQPSTHPPESPPQTSPYLFSMPAVTDPNSSELSVNLKRTILCCTVTSAGKQLQLPLDSCCSVTLCSLNHAQHIQAMRPELNFKKLEKNVPVQMADSTNSLQAVAVQEVPILWLPNKETLHIALVVPNLAWSLLFGENHLAATQALSDHYAKTVTFRHPSMQFTVTCTKDPPSSDDPQAAVTCLLTGHSSSTHGTTPQTVVMHRGLNLLTAYPTLTSTFSLANQNLWINGRELEPGVRVLDGPCNLSEMSTTTVFHDDHTPDSSSTSTPINTVPEFEQHITTTLLVQCNKKKAKIPTSMTYGSITVTSNEQQVILKDAIENTIDYLTSDLVSHVQPSPEESHHLQTRSFSTIPYQAFNPKRADAEMTRKGLTDSSSLLSPFSSTEDADDRDLPPQLVSTNPMTPNSEQYHTMLCKELRLDSADYSHVPTDVMTAFDALLHKYPTAFILPGSPLRRIHGIYHSINTGNAIPQYRRPYRMSPSELQGVRQQINDMLRQNIIQPSKSPWGAPAILVRRKDVNGKPQPPRFVVDYRALNSVTKSDGFPLPHVTDILDWLGGGKLFAKLDLASGYWQVPLHPNDREKTAVVTHCGLFEFLSMPFGLKTAGATFQRLMQTAFADYLMGNVTGCSDSQKGFCMPYVDDLCTRSATFVEALDHYEKILARAVEVGIQFKPSKCTFFAQSLEVLGHIITTNGRLPDPKKTEAIQLFPTPSCQTDIQKFLGMVGFYRHHISNFAQRTFHLRQLLKKGQKFELCSESLAEFNDLRRTLEGPNVLLQYPDWNKTFHVHTDASKKGIGAVLMQEDDDHNLLPLQFASRSLNPTQQRWDTREQELFAVKWAVEQWRPYLLGQHFIIETDHANLRWLSSIAPQKGKLARWASLLAEYDFELRHRPGHKNPVPDALSRYPQDHPSSYDITDSPIVIPPADVSIYVTTAIGFDLYCCNSTNQNLPSTTPLPEAILLATTTPLETEIPMDTEDIPSMNDYSPDATTLSSIGIAAQEFSQHQRNDPLLGQLYDYLCQKEQTNPPGLPQTADRHKIEHLAKRCVIEDGLLKYADEYHDPPNHFRILVPDDKQVKHHLLRAYHDSPMAMHRGRDATYHALSRDFYWRGMAKAVQRWIRRCLECLQYKSLDQKHGTMHAFRHESPMDTLGIDFVGPFPKSSQGNRYILTAVCPFSHFLVAIPTCDKSAQTAARMIFDHVFLKFGFPRTLLSDRGGEFLNAIMENVAKHLSIERVFTSSYRPRANGSTERVHRFLNSALAIYASNCQRNWEDFLQPATFSHNTSVIDGTQDLTPFFLMYGRQPKSPESIVLEPPTAPTSRNEYAEHLVQRTSEAHRLFSSITSDLRRRQRDYYDLGSRQRNFQIGQKVLVRKPPSSNAERGLSSKLVRRYTGPFKIIERLPNSDLYRLQHVISKEMSAPTNVEKLLLVPEADSGDLRDSMVSSNNLPAQEPAKYKLEEFVMYTPCANDLQDEGVAYRVAEYLQTKSGKAPVSEVCKHLYQVFPPSRQILVKIGKMRGLTTHCPYLELEGQPNGGTYYVILDEATFRQSHAERGYLVGKIVDINEVQDVITVHSFSPTRKRSRLARTRDWLPVYNHIESNKSIACEPTKRPVDYDPDYQSINSGRILASKPTLAELLCVRHIDEAIAHRERDGM